MSIRAQKIINAFICCVREKIFTYEYAIILLEDESKYGFLTDDDKKVFYTETNN